MDAKDTINKLLSTVQRVQQPSRSLLELELGGAFPEIEQAPKPIRKFYNTYVVGSRLDSGRALSKNGMLTKLKEVRDALYN